MAAFPLEEYLDEQRETIDARLRGLIEGLETGSPGLKEAIAYSLYAGAKRLRPILLIASHAVFSPPGPYALDAACAVEMLHTYSLIHDDLPSFDDDDLRRGRPSSHVVFGEWMAILAGDALNSLAFEVLAGGSDGTPPEMKLEVLRIISSATGPRGMAGGQALDMVQQGREATEEEVIEQQKLKTGALVAAAAETGALLGGAGGDGRNRLRLYGLLLGQAFQIRDDLLDIEGKPTEMGKLSGKDGTAGKATLPAVIGKEAARRRAKRLAGEAADALAAFGAEAEPLRAIAAYVVARNK